MSVNVRITSPGSFSRGKSRKEWGLPGRGPVKCITNMGILEPDENTGEFVLTAIYPGVTFAQVKANVGWALKAKEPLQGVALPTAQEIKLLREKLDPKKLHIK